MLNNRQPNVDLRTRIATWLLRHRFFFLLGCFFLGAAMPLTLPFVLWYNWPTMGKVAKITGCVLSATLIAGAFGFYILPLLGGAALMGATALIITICDYVYNIGIALAMGYLLYSIKKVNESMVDASLSQPNENHPNHRSLLDSEINLEATLDNFKEVTLDNVAAIPENFQSSLTNDDYQSFSDERDKIFRCPISLEAVKYPVLVTEKKYTIMLTTIAQAQYSQIIDSSGKNLVAPQEPNSTLTKLMQLNISLLIKCNGGQLLMVGYNDGAWKLSAPIDNSDNSFFKKMSSKTRDFLLNNDNFNKSSFFEVDSQQDKAVIGSIGGHWPKSSTGTKAYDMENIKVWWGKHSTIPLTNDTIFTSQKHAVENRFDREQILAYETLVETYTEKLNTVNQLSKLQTKNTTINCHTVQSCLTDNKINFFQNNKSNEVNQRPLQESVKNELLC